MNDLEKLLASLPTPRPSKDLDERIRALRRRPRVVQWSRWGSRAAVSTVVVLAFLLGRWSVQPAMVPDPLVSTSTTQPQAITDDMQDAYVHVELPYDELAGLLVAKPKKESFLRDDTLTVNVTLDAE